MVCLSEPPQKGLRCNATAFFMKRCKYINEKSVVWLRNPLREDGRVFCNPSTDELNRLGYYPLTDSPRGEPRTGYIQAARYQLADSGIVRTWVYEEEKEEA